ncbi:MAG: histidinol dehydrogenase [Chloroflexi bacterium]|nr:histidinol dehydrogenase [Chloroflexota bacterium]
MRVVQGLENARRFARQRASTWGSEPPPEVAERIAAIFGRAMTPREAVSLILESVRQKGDEALRELTTRIDGITLGEIEVPPGELLEAHRHVPADLLRALELAAERVAAFARASVPRSWRDASMGVGELVAPLERVGLYAPGGTAAYPSTVIMTAVTARTAGVGEVILCTPSRDSGAAAVLAAAHIAHVDRVFRIGGAQAIAAMAYGTASVPRVDMVCGPGNIFVTLAKQLLFGEVGIDGLFGPTETVIVADESADPRLCAADLLAQAEHDPLASPVLITPWELLPPAVDEELERQLPGLERREIARTALDRQGAFVLTQDLDEALAVANLLSPEHLCLMVREPGRWLEKVRNAGGLFLGEGSPEVLGDYVAGPSHTMPTAGSARFASYLGAHQFVRRIPVVALEPSLARRLAGPAAIIARAEGFGGHARAAELRAARRGEAK